MKFQSFVNFPKKIKEIIKMFLHFWFFTCCPHSFSFRASLCFIIFILSLCSNMLNLENILEYIRQKLKKHAHFKISSRDEVLTRLFFFFSYRDEISSLSFWQGWVHPGMKFRFGKSITFITNFKPKKVFHF